MKRLLAIALLLFCVGCDRPDESFDIVAEVPIVNLPLPMRQANWEQRGEGSCVHATMVSLLRWQGRVNMAEYWRRTYGGGEWADETWNAGQNLARKLDEEGLRYAYVTNGDVTFLEWACATRRGAGVTVKQGRHMVALVHLDAEWAGLLDNNDVERIIWTPRDEFIKEWQNSRGWAVSPVYTPATPLTTR